MALVLEIILGVMVLASFFVAYMSARTWQIYQVVLVVFVFLGSVTFFVLAARTLATHRSWRSQVQNYERDLDTANKRIEELRDGARSGGQVTTKGIRQLRADLANMAADRGGVLYDVTLDGVKDGTVQLTAKSPSHGLVANSVVFAFDQLPVEQGGRYQGEFKVASVAEESPAVQLTPNLPLTAAQTQQLASAKGPWTLYTTMPIDDLSPPPIPPKPPADPNAPGAAADAAQPTDPTQPPVEAPVAAAPPAAEAPVAAAPAAPADRPLNDYEYIFHEHYVQTSVLNDTIAQVTSNIERTDASTKRANEEIAYRGTEKTNLASDLDKFQFERNAIAEYQKSLEKRYAGLRESLKATFVSNKQKVAELTASQLRAADDINRRASAQGGALVGAAAATP